MKLEVVEHVTLYKDSRFHAAFPAIVRLDDGGFLLAFRRARDCNWLLQDNKDFDPLAAVDHLDSRSHICLMNLDSQLRPMGEPRIYPIDPEAADQDPSLLNMGDGRIMLSSFSWYPVPGYALSSMYADDVADRVAKSRGCGYRYWGSHVGYSQDNGQSWQFHHEYLDKTDRWEDGKRIKTFIGATRGQCLSSDNELLLATYEGSGEALLWSSNNDGFDWSLKSVIANDMSNRVYFQEPALFQAAPGKIIAFMRTQGADFQLATAFSDDQGQTWRPYQLHEIRGQPFHAIALDTQHLMLSYGYREKPYGIRCGIFKTRSGNLECLSELIVREDGVCPDLGYTWNVRLNSSTLMIAYYWTDEKGSRQIKASCIRFLNL